MTPSRRIRALCATAVARTRPSPRLVCISTRHQRCGGSPPALLASPVGRLYSSSLHLRSPQRPPANPVFQPVLSAGAEDPARLSSALVSHLQSSRWTLSRDARGIERTYAFKTFKKTWAFMGLVASAAQARRHHPEWSNVYNKVHIRWTTHNPPGLSDADLALAQYCDEQARELGEMVDEEGGGPAGQLEDMTDGMAAESAGCCGRSEK